MGAFPTGVVVATALDGDGAPHGTTLNAFCSVSADPPLLLLSLSHESRTLAVLRQRRQFAVNFLGGGGGALSATFASKREGKFDGIAWRVSALRNPILHEAAIAHAECELFSESIAGDHTLVLGRVVAGRTPSHEDRPLVYFRRAYHDWAPLVRDVQAGSRRQAGKPVGETVGLESDR